MQRNRQDEIDFDLRDFGARPQVFNIARLTRLNPYYRTTLWTGEHLQLTLMSINVRGDIGLEMHEDTDQFIRIESGYALVQMGSSEDSLDFSARVNANYAVVFPAGTWHNITNIGSTPLKLYSIYAPPHHMFGTIHKTREDSDREHT